MPMYRITSRSGVDFGVWHGATPEDAFEAMVLDAGDTYDHDRNRVAGTWRDWIIEEACPERG